MHCLSTDHPTRSLITVWPSQCHLDSQVPALMCHNTHTVIHINTQTYIYTLYVALRPLSRNSWEINLKTTPATQTHTGIQTQGFYDTLWFFISFSWPPGGSRFKRTHTPISHNLEKLKLEGNWITSELTQPRDLQLCVPSGVSGAANPDPSSSPHSLPCLACARISIRSCQISSNTPQRWWNHL